MSEIAISPPGMPKRCFAVIHPLSPPDIAGSTSWDGLTSLMPFSTESEMPSPALVDSWGSWSHDILPHPMPPPRLMLFFSGEVAELRRGGLDRAVGAPTISNESYEDCHGSVPAVGGRFGPPFQGLQGGDREVMAHTPCLLSSLLCWTSDSPAGVIQEEGHTGFVHL